MLRNIMYLVGTSVLTLSGAILMLVSPQVEIGHVASAMFFSGLLFIASALCIALDAHQSTSTPVKVTVTS